MKNAALNAPHTAELPDGNVTARGKKQGIYVCGSDEERKPFAPSSDNRGQSGIDGINYEWWGTETQLLSFCIELFL